MGPGLLVKYHTSTLLNFGTLPFNIFFPVLTY